MSVLSANVSPGLTHSLKTPRQLLEKLRVDFERMKRDPMNAYAAFDFFVTAEHMPDWLGPKSVKFKEPLLQIVSHIANGAKYFKVNPEKPEAVLDTEILADYFDPKTFGPYCNTDGIYVELTEKHFAEFGPRITAIDLASRVLDYWTARLALMQRNVAAYAKAGGKS